MHVFQKRIGLASSAEYEHLQLLLKLKPTENHSIEDFTKAFIKLAGSRWLGKTSYREILVKTLLLADQLAEWRIKKEKPKQISDLVDVESIEDYISLACYVAFAARCTSKRLTVTSADQLTESQIQELRQRAERKIDATSSSVNTSTVPNPLPMVLQRTLPKPLEEDHERLLQVILTLINIRTLNSTIGNLKTRSF